MKRVPSLVPAGTNLDMVHPIKSLEPTGALATLPAAVRVAGWSHPIAVVEGTWSRELCVQNS